MKQIKWGLLLFLTSVLATAGAVRTLDGALITNGAATLTLPTTTDTIVGRATTDTLSNKLFSDIAPDDDGTVTLGGSGAQWNEVFSVDYASTGTYRLKSGANTILNIGGGSTTPAGFSVQTSIKDQAGVNGASTLGIFSVDQATTVPTGSLLLETGNQTGSVASGDIKLTIGTAGGTQGVFKFLKAGVPSVATQIWTASGTDGTGYWATASAPAPALSGTFASPTAVTAAGGVVFSGTNYSNYYFLEGSAGPIDVTANPQISVGSNVGQRLTLVGRSDTNTLTLEHGTGLSLNGTIVLAADSSIDLLWNGTTWSEIARR